MMFVSPCVDPVDVVDVMLIGSLPLVQSAALAVFPEHICEPKEGQSNRKGGEAQEDEESIAGVWKVDCQCFWGLTL